MTFETHHFNGLTEAQAERLAILAEECGEVIQVIGKILRHGYESRHPDQPVATNRELLQKEVGDVAAALDLLVIGQDLDAIQIREHRSHKRDTILLHHP